MAALERFSGKGLRLVIMNPSLLLGPGDDRLSSTKVVLDFMARKIGAVPNGGLNFVDVRDTAQAFRVAMEKGRHGERYLLGAVNWTLRKVLRPAGAADQDRFTAARLSFQVRYYRRARHRLSVPAMEHGFTSGSRHRRDGRTLLVLQ